MQTNEIRDYLERGPKRLYFRDGRMVNTTYVRLIWLSTIARGLLDEKINRRAGIIFEWRPFARPVNAAIRRNRVKQLKRAN
jgi:hypothetical protein